MKVNIVDNRVEEEGVRTLDLESNRLEVRSPSGRLYFIDQSDPSTIFVYNDEGRRMLRVGLKGISAKAMVKRIRENIETGAPAYLAGWPPKDVDRILSQHAIACER